MLNPPESIHQIDVGGKGRFVSVRVIGHKEGFSPRDVGKSLEGGRQVSEWRLRDCHGEEF